MYRKRFTADRCAQRRRNFTINFVPAVGVSAIKLGQFIPCDFSGVSSPGGFAAERPATKIQWPLSVLCVCERGESGIFQGLGKVFGYRCFVFVSGLIVRWQFVFRLNGICVG